MKHGPAPQKVVESLHGSTFSLAYRRYVLTAVTAVYMLNLVDRGLMILLLQPIKEDLQLSDTQLGFLTGIAFGLFYAVLGVPIARMADRGNRVSITCMAISLWSVTVMACLFVTSYLQLVLARIAAAIGESGCKPPTYSLIGDYFPERAARTGAMAIYMSGSPLAMLASFTIGGWISEHYGWRYAFFFMGIPGILLAAMVKFTVIEPRTLSLDSNTSQSPPLPLTSVLMVLWGQRSFRHLTISLILLYTLGLGLSPWYAAFMMRSHGMGTAELGVWFGLIFSLAGLAGILLGGYVATRWFAEDERGQMRLSAISVACLLPCFVIFLTVQKKSHALAALVPLMLVFSVFLGPTYSIMQRLVAAEMRATMMSVVMLLANLLGFGLGPQIVGALSDWLAPFAGVDSLRYSMLIMSFLAVWASYHLWVVGESVESDMQKLSQAAARPEPQQDWQQAQNKCVVRGTHDG